MALRKLSGPALFWYGLFLIGPLLWIFLLSFQTRGTYGGIVWSPSLVNYAKVFEPSYLLIYFRSLLLAFSTAMGAVLLAVVLSWAVLCSPKNWRIFYLAALVLPFLINLIIRVYALRILLSYDGPLQTILRTFHIEFDPFSITSNSGLVFYGMITTYLPFAVLPIYSALSRFDFALFEAAVDLGATANQAFLRVVVPSLKGAMISAFALVFIPALGEYVIPDLLGGAKTMYMGNLLTEEFLKSRNWPLGSALAMSLIMILLLMLLIIRGLPKLWMKKNLPVTR
ncbi:MAG: ABC transporter permease [Pseudobdellovibrionaceae bacterium]